MQDHEILKALGVGEYEATDKINSAIADPEGVAGATSDPAEAAAALGGDCTAADVHRFVSARATTGPGVALIYWGPVADSD